MLYNIAGDLMKIIANNYTAEEIMRIIREWTQLSQKEFAKSINRSESGIQAFELGKRSYDVKTLLQIAQIHNIEITIEKKDK